MKAIVDAANAETAVLRNRVIGRQVNDILRAPTRLFESEMGNLVADAMRDKYPGIDAAYTNSGGLRADLVFAPPSAGEQPGEITWGEMFAVLPFGNRTVILTLTGADLRAAFVNGFTPFCQPGFPGGTGRFPQISGLKVEFALQRDDSRGGRDVEGAERSRRDADADRPDRHRAVGDERLHVRRR